MSRGKKFYVVWEGHAPGIYDSWEECQQQVNGFPGARFRSFDSQDDATRAFRGDDADELYAIRAIARHKKQSIVNYAAFPEIHLNAIAVDAACSGNPGPMEYRGVDVGSGAQLFHFGPVNGTNNIGEFLALVHALALCEQQGWTMPIYSDSKTAQSWIRQRKAKTTLPHTPDNAKLHSLIARAEDWLATHTPQNPIIKWDTERWGEIPADFGRK